MVENYEDEGTYEEGAEDSGEVEVTEWTNQPVYHVLEKGRYTLKPLSFKHHNAKTGSKCIHVVFQAEGVKIHKYFILKDVTDKPHSMAYQWNQYLHASGIRDPRRNFNVSFDALLKTECKADIVKVKDTNASTDELIVYKNEISFFSPIDNEVAPMRDVPAEEGTAPEPPKEKEKSAEKPKEKPKDKPKKDEPKKEPEIDVTPKEDSEEEEDIDNL